MPSNILFTPNFNILGTAAAPVTTGTSSWIPVDQAVRLRIVAHSSTGVTSGTIQVESSDTNTTPAQPFVTDSTHFVFTTGDTVLIASYYLNTDKAFGPFVRLNITANFAGGGAPGVYAQIQGWR